VKRFGRQLAALTCGRVCLVSGSSATLSVALTIAVRFAAGRKQFGPPGEPEQRNNDPRPTRSRLRT
jgi:acyl-CoA oxidase